MIAPQFRPLVGGYERAAERLAAELAKQGQEVTILTERRVKSWPSKETVQGFKLRRLWCIYRPRIHAMSSLLSFIVFLLAKGWRYHVIHVHQYGYHAALAVLVGKMFQIPVVIKITSTGLQGIQEALAGEQKAPGLLASLHRKMDACIATTKEAQEEASRFGIAQDRNRFIPNGIDTNFFKPCDMHEKEALKSRLGLRRSLTVLYSGRLSPVKNPEGLIEAWHTIYREMPNAELVLIGEGPLQKTLEDRVTALGLNASVRFAGLQSEVLSWYQAADIFVLPSHREGLSNSLLEAMSCGLPVVSTRVSGSTGIFAGSDVGELVEVGDSPGLVTGLRCLLTDPARRATCSLRARDYASTTFSIQAVAEKTLALYTWLVEGGRRCS
jgi:glycosyltransferase involved in cell wall biosynthesis